MFHPAAVLVACVAMTACTVVKINPGDSQTIEYEGGTEVANDLTSRACRKAGQPRAEIISTENKNKSLPPGQGRQVTTFRCTSSPAAKS
jgi:hypothetical protein